MGEETTIAGNASRTPRPQRISELYIDSRGRWEIIINRCSREPPPSFHRPLQRLRQPNPPHATSYLFGKAPRRPLSLQATGPGDRPQANLVPQQATSRLPLPHWRHHHRPLLHTGNSSKNRAISLATTAPTPCEHFHPTNDLGSTPRRQSTRSLAPQLTRPTWPHCQRTGLTGRRKDR